MNIKPISIILALGTTLPLGGCAGTINTVMSDIISSDHLAPPQELPKLKSYAGSRRLVRVEKLSSPQAPGQNNIAVCAETWADALQQTSADGALSITQPASTGGELTDKSTTTHTLTYTRTQLSDIVRQQDWQLCNAWLNGVISPVDYKMQLFKNQSDAFEALKLSAQTPPKADPAAPDKKDGNTDDATAGARGAAGAAAAAAGGRAGR